MSPHNFNVSTINCTKLCTRINSQFQASVLTVIVNASGVTASHCSSYLLLPRKQIHIRFNVGAGYCCLQGMLDETLFIPSQKCSSGCIMYLINPTLVWAFRRWIQSTELLVLRLPPVLSDLRLPPVLLDLQLPPILLDLPLLPFFQFANLFF